MNRVGYHSPATYYNAYRAREHSWRRSCRHLVPAESATSGDDLHPPASTGTDRDDALHIPPRRTAGRHVNYSLGGSALSLRVALSASTPNPPRRDITTPPRRFRRSLG